VKPEKTQYIQYRVARARETLNDARLLISDGSLHSAVNRLYYACFYIVSALLLTQELSSSRHSGVRSLFVKHWVNTGVFPKEMGRFYHHLFERRQISDYKDLVVFTREDVDAWLRQADDFVSRISEEIEKA
jgi:uncharacterized protein (UPF0332 family)